jgi:hypothetical protein
MLVWAAALVVLGLSVMGPQRAQARPRRGAQHGAQHAWQRDVGHRLSRPAKRRDQRQLRFDDTLRDIPISSDVITKQIEALRSDPRARVQRIGRGTFGNPVYRIDVPGSARPGKGVRATGGPPLKVLVGAWLHGNEPVGPKAALQLVNRALRKKGFRQRFDLSVIVKVDPWGTRERPDGVNLNRRFAAGRWTPESWAIKRSVRGERFDLFVDLHGAKRDGFFLIRGQDDGNISRRILSAMKTGALLDAAPSSPKVGPYHMHSLGGAWSGTEGTFKGYMTGRGVPYSYTLEAPRSLKPRQQVSGMFKLLRSTLDNVARHGQFRGRTF